MVISFLTLYKLLFFVRTFKNIKIIRALATVATKATETPKKIVMTPRNLTEILLLIMISN